MKAIKFVLLMLIFFSWLIGKACADTLYLKNGRHIEGIIRSEEGDFINLEVCGGSVKFKKSEIDKVARSDLQEQGAIQQQWQVQMQDWQKRVLIRERQEASKPKTIDFKEEIRPKDVEFSDDSKSITLPVTLNKKVQATLILDTGASVIMLKKEFAKKLGVDLSEMGHNIQVVLADGRKTKARHIILESVKVQNVEAKDVDAAILIDEPTRENEEDFERPASTMPSDGLLGMSFLKHFNFKIDHKEKKLILEKL
ncbi:MAG: hypothetical protein A3K83_02875 [Omnitrophica WOR_2 bacterium RBG_13_44_8b]|nr:MAG: hypothetical protein A3K83_02875 [Omnitrophica WOR_2 bacterium RBG_13_44_8b]